MVNIENKSGDNLTTITEWKRLVQFDSPAAQVKAQEFVS